MVTAPGDAGSVASTPIARGAAANEVASAPARIAPPRLIAWCERHYTLAASAVLGLAALNLFYRLNQEIVTDWDESLYATSAWEALTHGHWVATTFLGEIDYYNSKPPLNVWLIALGFRIFGASLISLRLWSALAAWATVAVLQEWSRRAFGPAVAVLSGLVLTTSFAFLYVHSGRSGNPDSLFTLVILLTVVAFWSVRKHPWQAAWVGPLVAAAFLLKGMGVLLPLTIVLAVQILNGWPRRGRRLPIFVAAALFVVPVAVWAVARWSVDGTEFFRRMLTNDLVGISLDVQDGHKGTPLFYLDILQKHHYEWLAAAALAWVLFPVGWSRIWHRARDPQNRSTSVLLACWVAACLAIPTAMQTKLAWYLNPFYPAFALAVGAMLAHGFSASAVPHLRRRRIALSMVLVLAAGLAEGKLLWYSYKMRDINQSAQGLLLAERERLAGSRVFRDGWNPGDLFVLRAFVGAEQAVASDREDFLRKSRPGDYFMTPAAVAPGPALLPVRAAGQYALYRRPGPYPD